MWLAITAIFLFQTLYSSVICYLTNPSVSCTSAVSSLLPSSRAHLKCATLTHCKSSEGDLQVTVSTLQSGEPETAPVLQHLRINPAIFADIAKQDESFSWFFFSSTEWNKSCLFALQHWITFGSIINQEQETQRKSGFSSLTVHEFIWVNLWASCPLWYLMSPTNSLQWMWHNVIKTFQLWFTQKG